MSTKLGEDHYYEILVMAVFVSLLMQKLFGKRRLWQRNT
ncbi:hypothetical protein GCHA_0531 [Paraglaciecola chathamensis S18K6]|uniref:Uncharacterized protein n=1 Tax=Paraglaciecola chathamensis S18K6 TaxID=1127672 RepID=A0AAV3UTN9_9ALTE|nr:hypothetical protein GCHA_0531 [Paraglaciecola chathamensis S18K6]